MANQSNQPNQSHQASPQMSVAQKILQTLSKPIQSSRESLVDTLYTQFKTEIDKDTVMKLSEFRRYEILFKPQVRQEYLENKLTGDQLETLSTLSQEFYNSVNTRKPIHIVDDASGKEVYTLPPIFMRLETLKGEATHVVDLVTEAFNHDDGNPNSPTSIRKARSIALLRDELLKALPADRIVKSAQEYQQLANKIAHPENSNSQAQGTGTPAATGAAQDTPPEGSPNPFLDFEPVDED